MSRVITLAVPTKLSIHASTMLCIMNASVPNHIIGFRTLVGKSNIDQARSMMITDWYDSSNDDDLFLFVDGDQTFSTDDIIALVELNVDVAVGVYPSMGKYPCCRPYNYEKFVTGEDNNLLYGATGFMMIRKGILKRIEKFIQDENFGISRYHISHEYPNTIPFFKQRLIRSETIESKYEWLGEDYSFCWMVRRVGGIIKCHVSPTIGHEVTQKLIYYPDTYKTKKWEQNTIVYYAGMSRVKWSPTDPEKKGLGGSEMAVIQLSKFWTLMGWKVVVYGNVEEGVFDNVNYLSYEKFSTADQYNILVLWRSYGIVALPHIRANKIFIDLHDEMDKQYEIVTPHLPLVSAIVVKSKFHASAVPSAWKDKIVVIENGVPAKYFNSNVSRDDKWNNRHKLIYASSYDRGLVETLRFSIPLLRQRVPEIEFHIYYGSELLPVPIKQVVDDLLKQDRVFDHGRVSQDELFKAKVNSGFQYYLSTQGETDCISIKESALAGCIPIVSSTHMFSERPYSMMIEGDPRTAATHAKAVDKLVSLLLNREEFDRAHDKMASEISKINNWETIARQWDDILRK